MGYRLDIELKSYYDDVEQKHYFDKNKPIMLFGKLYGYCNEKETKSWKYLKEIGLVNGTERWGDGYYPDFEITPEQLKIFAPLYIEDLISMYKWEENELKEYRKEQYKILDELLSYNENVILNWG